MSDLTILSDHISPRLRYVCDFIFGQMLGIKHKITDSQQDISGKVIIHYNNNCSNASYYQIPMSGLLEENGIKPQVLEIAHLNGLPYFFGNKGKDLPFDIFSLVFYLISRYEEYLPSERDEYERYQSSQSIASKADFLHMPLVDLWISKLSSFLNEKFLTNWKIKGTYCHHTTVDIDLPYAFNGKGWKAYLGLLRDVVSMNPGTFKCRTAFWLGGKDPFDQYEWLETNSGDNQTLPTFFFHNRLGAKHDDNHLAFTPELKRLIESVQKWANVGIHPSFASHADISLLQQEFAFINDIGDAPIYKSRHHFLKFSLPKTYRDLLSLGIKEDYSMSYPDRLGFRASTSHPFDWYDLKAEKPSRLKVYSNCAMDVTMRKYLQLSPDEAILRCNTLKESCRQVHGEFRFIWHNSSLSEAYGWSDWRRVFLSLNDEN